MPRATARSAAPSEILYGPSGSEAAQTLAAVLGGPVTLVPDPSLSGTDGLAVDRRAPS